MRKTCGSAGIMSYAHGDVATMKLTTRKLANLGYVNSYGGIQNDPERIHRLTNGMEFTQSLAVITVLEQQDVAQTKAALVEELRAMSPAAKIKLIQKNNVSKLTKKDIVSLLLTWFVVKEDPSKNVKGIVLLC
jgi:predicted GIY-YIG superfamily endonuclease